MNRFSAPVRAVRPRLPGAGFALCGIILAAAGPANACACGCGVFGVGASSLFPEGRGETVFAEDDYMNQDANRSGTAPSPSAANPDKQIETNFFNLGVQHMFNRRWGVMVEMPFDQRRFRTDAGSGVQTFSSSSPGDLRVTGVYSGFSEDMSTGVTFGVRLPTGRYKAPGFDRDTQIGSGSTDLLLGAYHLGSLTRSGAVGYFVQAAWDKPLAFRGGYRPGAEINAATGFYTQGWNVGTGMTLTPILQLVGSVRQRDRGPAAHPDDSGYERLLLTPGLEFKARTWRLYGDVSLPVYQRVNGEQLVARQLFKVVLSRSF